MHETQGDREQASSRVGRWSGGGSYLLLCQVCGTLQTMELNMSAVTNEKSTR